MGAISETMHGDCEYNHMVNFNNKILLSIADDKHIHSREQEVKLNRLSNLLPAYFANFLSHSCCFPRNLPGQMLLLYREQIRFNMLPQDERKNSLLAAFHMRYRKDLDELGAFLMYGRPVCPSCYRGLYDISLSDFQRTLKLVKEGTLVWSHGNRGNEPTMSNKGYLTRDWFSNFVFTLGDFQPDSGQIHLPCSLDKKAVFMASDLGENNHLEKSSFYTIWQTEFSNVVIPPQQRLTKCSICKEISEQLNVERDTKLRLEIQQRRKEHIDEVRASRAAYYKWRKLAREFPDKYLSLIIDGPYDTP
jgi:hypothetical protein